MLGAFECAAVFEVGGDAGGPKGVAADVGRAAECGGAALNEPQGIGPMQAGDGEFAAAGDGAEEGRFAGAGAAGGGRVVVELVDRLAMGVQFVEFGALFVQAQPLLPALGVANRSAP